MQYTIFFIKLYFLKYMYSTTYLISQFHKSQINLNIYYSAHILYKKILSCLNESCDIVYEFLFAHQVVN